MAGEDAELAFVATMRDEASAQARTVRRTLDAVGGSTKPIETAVRARDEASSVLRGVGTKLDEVGRKMQKVGSNLTRYVTLPLAGLSVAVGKTSIDFSRGMGDVASLIPGNTARVEELRDVVLALGPETGASLADLSGGLYQTLSAFGDTADTAKVLETNAKAARAGAASVTDAIGLTSAVTKAYGDTSAKAVGKAADLALMTVRLGQTTFPELAASVGAVTPLTNELGASQEELFATMATFTGVTGGASEVSTQLRGALQSLMAPTADAAKALEAHGYASGKALVEDRGLAGAIGFLADESRKSGKPLASYISSIEGQVIALGLAGAQSKDYKNKLKEMSGATGATREAFDASTTGVGEQAFAWDQAKVEAQKLLVTLGDGLAPAIKDGVVAARPLVDTVIDLADSFADADPKTQKLITTVAGAALVLGPTLKVVGSLTVGVGRLATGFAALGPAGARGAAGVGAVGAGAHRATTQLSTMARTARIGAGAAGIGALAVGATSSNDAISTLSTVGGGALLGFGVGGPIGAAVGAGAGLLVSLATAGDDSAESFRNAIPTNDAYAATLDRISGAATGATREILYQSLAEGEGLEILAQYGISGRQAVDAALGRKAASEQVAAAIQAENAQGNEYLRQARATRAEVRTRTDLTAEEANTLLLHADSLEADGKRALATGQQIADLTRQHRQQGKAVRESAKASADYSSLVGKIPKRAMTKIQTDGLAATTKGIARLANRYDLTPKQVRTVIRETGAQTTEGKVKKMIARLREATKTPGDLRAFSTGVQRSVDKAERAASTGSTKLRKDVEGELRKVRGEIPRLEPDVRAATNRAQGTASTGGSGIGNALESGIITGFASTQARLSFAAAAAVSAAIAAAKRAARSKSPSKETAEIGADLGDGFVVGLNARAAAVQAAARRTVRGALGVMVADLLGAADSLDKPLGAIENRIGAFYRKKYRGRKDADKLASKATREAVKALADEERALRRNAKVRDTLNRRMREALDYSRQLRDSAIAYASVTSFQAVNDAPITAGFIGQDLDRRLAEIRTFRANLASLRGRGFDDAAIADLEAQGVESAGAYAAALAAGTDAQLAEINRTQRQIRAAAGGLGSDAVRETVTGLEREIRSAERAGRRLARSLLSAIRDELGIGKGKGKGRGGRGGRDNGHAYARDLADGIRDGARDAETAARDTARRVAAAGKPARAGGIRLDQTRASTPRAATVTRSVELIRIRHEIVSPDGSISDLTAAQVADLVARDPRSARKIETALAVARRRRSGNTISASS